VSIAYLIRRLLLLPITLLGITIICFSVLQLAPGSPVNLRLMKLQGSMSSQGVPDRVIQQMKEHYGLDKPVWQQYTTWLGKLVVLDFGKSMKDERPVITKITEALPYTLQLQAIAIFLIYSISIPIGIFSATNSDSIWDRSLTVGLFVMYSLPSFWVAMLLLYYLSSGQFLDWFPVYGLNSTGADKLSWWQWIYDRAWHLVLPIICLTYGDFAAMSRYARSDLMEVIRQDFIRTVRAYGFSERTVILKYAMRNALISLITIFASVLPSLIAGSIIIEQIFSIPGMGRLLFESILARDYPTVMGILTISAFLTLIGLIISDILLAVANPRVQFE
jgi:peptide/nickel transport system permease protein